MNTSEGGGTPPENTPFSAEELAQSAEGPMVDPELDDVDAANIGEQAAEAEAESAETVTQRGRRLPPERVKLVVESLLFVAEAPLTVDQLKQATGIKKDALETALAALAQ